jgi:hypothetical protein
LRGLVIAGGNLFAVGGDGTGWRIDKRDLTTGALVTAFGTNGRIDENISTSNEEAGSVTTDGTALYIGGWDCTTSPGHEEWRIEKRDLTTGGFVTTFGTNGVIVDTPSSAGEAVSAVIYDQSYLYAVGTDRSLGNTDSQWRIEKRLASDGSLVTSFGSGGVFLANPSTSDDTPYAMTVDSTYAYVVGSDAIPGDLEWRIQRVTK